jgi:hypothetical protein
MRLMTRNDEGKCCLRSGGNIMAAMEALTRYEEAAAAAEIDGAEELGKLLDGMFRATTPRQRRQWITDGVCPGIGPGEVPAIRHCNTCGHYQPDGEGAREGVCDRHPRKVRPGGGKRGPGIEIPGEHRHVAARRVACKSWIKKEE